MADQKQCRLCMQYFKHDEELMKIPICDHILHIHCLKKWLIDFQKCPVCESNIIRLPNKSKEKDQNMYPVGMSGSNGKNQSSEKVLSSAPGLRDYEEANKGRNMMVDGVASPQSSLHSKVVFSEE